MRIIIKEERKKNTFQISLPYHVAINLLVRKTWFRIALRHGLKATAVDEIKGLNYLEYLDFGELREALHNLSAQKGLVLIEIESASGTYVKITT
jgi:hypothetical protein